MKTNWSNGDFARTYAEWSLQDDNSFELKKNETSLISLLPKETITILDYGCSSGHFTNTLSQSYEVAGYDISAEAREFAKKSFPDLKIIDEVKEIYNCIVLKLVLHLVENPRKLLENLSHNVTTDGSFLISIPHPVDVAINVLDINYGEAPEAKYEHGIGNWETYWRPLKYWTNLFDEIGFSLVAVDEPTRDEKYPKRFNARFGRKPKPTIPQSYSSSQHDYFRYHYAR